MMMFRSTRPAVLVLALAALPLAGCSSSSPSTSPTAPTPAPTPSVTPPAKPTLGAPVPSSPLSGATVDKRPTLTVQNVTRTGTVTGELTYTFEIADNTGFNPVAVTGSVPEGSGQTSLTLSADLAGGKTYYWRAVAVASADGVTSTPSEAQTIATATPTQAAIIAEQRGVVLWTGAQPTGTAGHARLGPGWNVATRTSFDGVTFQSPPIDALRVFDLLDRGYDPDAALGWMRVNGYGSVPVYYASVQAIGFPYQYMALVNGAWELVPRVGA
jgi:hypothetical protein